MSDIQLQGEQLFATYLENWNAQNFAGIAACYSEPCQFVTPAGVASLPNRGEFVGFLTKLFTGLKEGGFSHSSAGKISVVRCNKNLAIMDVSNVKRLKGDGSVLEEIDAHYVLTASDDGWKFAAAIVCKPGWRNNT